MCNVAKTLEVIILYTIYFIIFIHSSGRYHVLAQYHWRNEIPKLLMA